MSLQLFYSKRCPKSREILSEILRSGVRPNFVLISVDKHLDTKRRMPKGIRVTPTVHRETTTQIHVYEGDDIKALIQQMSSPVGTQGAGANYNKDFISDSLGPKEPQQGNMGSAVMSAPSKNKYQQDSKSATVQDESWKETGNFEIADSGPPPRTDTKGIEAQRAEMDKMIEQRLESQKNDPKLQQWIQGVAIE